MLGPAIPALDDAPPAFTPQQRRGIRKIARRFGYPYDQWWDFVHEAWLKVHDGWNHVPRVEPATTKYIFTIARNLAIDLRDRFAEDAMTGAVVFSSLPEWDREDEDEQPGEDRPGTPEVLHANIERRVLASQLWARATRRDREAAGWLARTELDEETVPEIAADVRKSAASIYKRLSRLVARIRQDVGPPDAGEASSAKAEHPEAAVSKRGDGRVRS
jgi:RNA polymerase sigma factor (sigma-70 family)